MSSRYTLGEDVKNGENRGGFYTGLFNGHGRKAQTFIYSPVKAIPRNHPDCHIRVRRYLVKPEGLETIPGTLSVLFSAHRADQRYNTNRPNSKKNKHRR